MRWLKAVMQRLGWGACPSTTPSVPQEPQSSTVKTSRAKSGRPSKVAPEQSQPAKSKRKPKSLAAPSTKQGVSRKPKQKPVQVESGAIGSQVTTPARPSRQPVKPAVKAKQARVLRTTRVQSPKQEQVPVQTPMAKLSGESGKSKTTVRKTRQHAK